MVNYALTTSGLAALRRSRAKDYVKMDPTTATELQGIRSRESVDRARRGLPSQSAMDEQLARLEGLFPAWTIFFSKMSLTKTVWTATHPTAQESLVSYSPGELEKHLKVVDARLKNR